MATPEEIRQFKAAFKIEATRKNSSVRWDPPTGKLRAFQSQTSLAPVVAGLDQLAAKISQENVDVVLHALAALPKSKDKKYVAAISELKASLVGLRKELTAEAMEEMEWDGVDGDVIDDLKGSKLLTDVLGAAQMLEQDLRKPQLDLVSNSIRIAEAEIRKLEKGPKKKPADWAAPDLSKEKDALRALRRAIRTPLEAAFEEADAQETAAYKDPVQRAMVARMSEWKPGNVAVADLRTFPQCVGHGLAGQLAAAEMDEFSGLDAPTMEGRYSRLTPTPPKDATAYLNQWETSREDIAKGKTLLSECSNFAYDALGQCLLDEDLSRDYDMLQVGTMGGKHNIAVLVPKGQGATVTSGKGPFPAGTLIVDPWARAMGKPAKESLFASPDNFAYKKSLYPITVNFNSAVTPPQTSPFAPAPKPTDERVKEFKESRKMRAFYDQVGPFLDLDETFAGETDSVGTDLANALSSLTGLPADTNFTFVMMNRQASLLTIKYTTEGGEQTIDAVEYLRTA